MTLSWIKTWNLLRDDQTYLVMSAFDRPEGGHGFGVAGVWKGATVKVMCREGSYAVLPVDLPTSLDECQ